MISKLNKFMRDEGRYYVMEVVVEMVAFVVVKEVCCKF